MPRAASRDTSRQRSGPYPCVLSRGLKRRPIPTPLTRLGSQQCARPRDACYGAGKRGALLLAKLVTSDVTHAAHDIFRLRTQADSTDRTTSAEDLAASALRPPRGHIAVAGRVRAHDVLAHAGWRSVRAHCSGISRRTSDGLPASLAWPSGGRSDRERCRGAHCGSQSRARRSAIEARSRPPPVCRQNPRLAARCAPRDPHSRSPSRSPARLTDAIDATSDGCSRCSCACAVIRVTSTPLGTNRRRRPFCSVRRNWAQKRPGDGKSRGCRSRLFGARVRAYRGRVVDTCRLSKRPLSSRRLAADRREAKSLPSRQGGWSISAHQASSSTHHSIDISVVAAADLNSPTHEATVGGVQLVHAPTATYVLLCLGHRYARARPRVHANHIAPDLVAAERNGAVRAAGLRRGSSIGDGFSDTDMAQFSFPVDELFNAVLRCEIRGIGHRHIGSTTIPLAAFEPGTHVDDWFDHLGGGRLRLMVCVNRRGARAPCRRSGGRSGLDQVGRTASGSSKR